MYGHIITAGSIDMCSNAGIFTRGYPFTLSGEGYGKKLYPPTGMGTGDGHARAERVRVWGASTRTHTPVGAIPSIVITVSDTVEGCHQLPDE